MTAARQLTHLAVFAALAADYFADSDRTLRDVWRLGATRGRLSGLNRPLRNGGTDRNGRLTVPA